MLSVSPLRIMFAAGLSYMAFTMLRYSKAKFSHYIGISWLPTFALQSPIMKRTSFLGVSSRRSCRSSQNRSTSASSALLVYIDLDYCNIEWVALGMNRDHSIIFGI